MSDYTRPLLKTEKKSGGESQEARVKGRFISFDPWLTTLDSRLFFASLRLGVRNFSSMTTFVPSDPNFEARVRRSFARQNLMKTIGAEMTRVAPGEVEIELPFRSDLTQQHGYLHAGIVTSIMDSACGYAAMTLLPESAEVLSVEYKINLLSPARGERIIARGRVRRAGRKLSVCAGDAFAIIEGKEKTIATMLATMIAISEPS